MRPFKSRIWFFIWFLIVVFGFVSLAVKPAQAAEKPKKSNVVVYDSKKFIDWRMRLQDKISEKERQNILFAISEYYFWANDFSDARRALRESVSVAPVNISTFLANVYLYAIAKRYGYETQVAAIKKDLFQDRFVLLFDKFKKLTYTSLWKNKYEVHYFRDRIEVFLNGEMFEEITP